MMKTNRPVRGIRPGGRSDGWGRTALRRLALAAAVAVLGLAGPTPAGAQGACDEGAGTLGIQGLQCEGCTYSMSESGIDEARFRTEPQVLAVARGFTEGDRLRAGDRIVAIDGALVTSREGSDRLVGLRAAQNLTLRVRRDGRLVDLEITAGSACELRREVREGEVLVERMSELPPGYDLDALSPPSPAPLPPLKAPAALPSTAPTPGALGPRGYLGFGIRCSDCTLSPSGFEFSGSPTIMNIDPDGPAAESGLQSGDVILEMDGMDITGAGTERFNDIEPGDTVRLTYRRGDREATATLVAAARPAPSPPTSAVVRGNVALAVPPSGMPRLMRTTVQYEGTVAGAVVEVRGAPVTATVDPETGELVIRTAGNEIRIRPEG